MTDTSSQTQAVNPAPIARIKRPYKLTKKAVKHTPWTPEEDRFLRELMAHGGYSCSESARKLTDQFNREITKGMIQRYMKNNSIVRRGYEDGITVESPPDAE